MLYTFKSGATGNLIMSAERADQLLGIIGKEPAVRGIVAAAALPAAIEAIVQAVAADDAARPPATQDDEVTLRQRAWPLVELFKHAQQAQVAVVWGA
jgi:Domain of unknown function (DUF1840)